MTKELNVAKRKHVAALDQLIAEVGIATQQEPGSHARRPGGFGKPR